MTSLNSMIKDGYSKLKERADNVANGVIGRTNLNHRKAETQRRSNSNSKEEESLTLVVQIDKYKMFGGKRRSQCIFTNSYRPTFSHGREVIIRPIVRSML